MQQNSVRSLRNLHTTSGAESDEGPSLSKGSEAGDSSADRQENEIDAEDEDSGFFSNNQI